MKKNVKPQVAPTQLDPRPAVSIARLPTETPGEAMARTLARGILGNAMTVDAYSELKFSEMSLMDLSRALRDQGDAVSRGDFAGAEHLLAAQAVTLNAMFVELARRAANNFGHHIHIVESYLRLAFKAQAQCRATLETLAEMKSPRPVAFVRQANISNGPQQVNNGLPPDRATARAQEIQSELNELSEAGHGLLENAGASQATVGTNSGVKAMDKIQRA